MKENEQPPNEDAPLTRSEVQLLLERSDLLSRYEVRCRHFPIIAPGKSLEGSSLPIRAQNLLLQLRASRGITDVSQLSAFVIGDLFEIPQIDRKSVIQLLTVVFPFILDETQQPIGHRTTELGREKLLTPSNTAGAPLSHAEVGELLKRPIQLTSPETRWRRFPRISASARMNDIVFPTRVENRLLEL